MKIGDLVRVKDALGFNAYMQNLVGHTGVVVETGCHMFANSTTTCVKVFLLGKVRKMFPQDLEVIA